MIDTAAAVGDLGLVAGVRPTHHRALQISLGVVWLIAAALQCQPVMFTPDFAGTTLSAAAAGNPGFVAAPIDWVVEQVQRFPVGANIAFIVIQAALGVGLLWRRTTKLALVGTVVWALAVWWLGEGFGGLFNGTANPLMGAPGAVLLYALLAVLIWPPRDESQVRSPAGGGLVGHRLAAVLWLVLWGGFAVLSVLPVNWAPQNMIAGMANGEPGWLAGLDRSVGDALAGQGVLVSVLLCVVCALIAVGVVLPAPFARGAVVLAVVFALVSWVVGQNFGTVLTGNATDPNSGPLLVLLAVAYWPPARRP
ncbi:MAG TPA: hypothetical protein VGL06_01180 [Pseudonocardiaceae bacterium]